MRAELPLTLRCVAQEVLPKFSCTAFQKPQKVQATTMESQEAPEEKQPIDIFKIIKEE